jgi:UDP-glucose 4-epimerase
MKYFVTGGAGFIGCNMVNRLLKQGHHVVVYDNLVTGFRRFLDEASKTDRFSFVQNDLLSEDALAAAMKGVDVVMHFAANADVRFGTKHPRRDLEQNTTATFNVLDAMRKNDIRKIMFSSTGAIYGDCSVIPTPEDAPLPLQTSFYGASKLACEGLINAFCEGYGFQAWIFRFVSILGEWYHHGHVADFYKKLREDPKQLHVLGNGRQKKSYLYVQDCLDAILLAMEKSTSRCTVLNLGTDEYIEVNQSLGLICDRLSIQPRIEYAGGERGWVGDNPFVLLDGSRIKALGWQPKTSIRDGVLKTLECMIQNPWILDAPDRGR